MATYAIGDLQGCFDPLRRLLDYISFDPAADRLWFVGDLVNRGPASLEVLRFVKSLGTMACVVLGNHDLHLVMQSEGCGKANREDTLAPILAAPDRDELLSWLRAQPLFHVEGEWAMVHAGLLPEWTVAQAQALSDEVSTALQAPNFEEFLANMWGSEPATWHDDLAGWDRLRVVVNAMTRMRFVTSSGAMEFRAEGSKGPPEKGPAGCRPWFDVPGRASADHAIVCGHWSALGFRDEPGLLALDTGCLWGGCLTAVRLEDRRVFRQPCSQQVLPSGWD
ncbi:MAG: symmetrical bis(5'-nucleosyl)-tetraphosphatase [Rhodocyclales bacterium]|nr:symmetrical bis(5'-nucleosyl)-tetraphosphatase [Rhodocyclales bacterium]